MPQDLELQVNPNPVLGFVADRWDLYGANVAVREGFWLAKVWVEAAGAWVVLFECVDAGGQTNRWLAWQGPMGQSGTTLDSGAYALLRRTDLVDPEQFSDHRRKAVQAGVERAVDLLRAAEVLMPPCKHVRLRR